MTETYFYLYSEYITFLYNFLKYIIRGIYLMGYSGQVLHILLLWRNFFLLINSITIFGFSADY